PVAGPAPGAHGAAPVTVAPALAFIADHGLWSGTDLADDVVAEAVRRTIMAWTTLFGLISFELFGHQVGSVADPEAWLDEVARRLATDLGIGV
uniref:TetR-like C-terminal domain-containing protein n=1 Tax=Promicromonospora kroppenstedtii TaxID=440482 RepID=UPI00056A3A66